jgi:holliday junction DNA helicase RuvA
LPIYDIIVKLEGDVMYAYLKGSIQMIQNDHVVLEVNGVGYKVLTPNPYYFSINTDERIYTYLYIREDAHELYGFKEEREKSLFEKLISVTGIGPKSACAILATGDVFNVISAIEKGDVHYLTKFPKVGPKTAQQIILDLKGKLGQLEPKRDNRALDEAMEALVA